MSTWNNFTWFILLLALLCIVSGKLSAFTIKPSDKLSLRLHKRDYISLELGEAFKSQDLNDSSPCIGIAVKPAPHQSITIKTIAHLASLPVVNLTYTYLYELTNRSASTVNLSVSAGGIGYANLKFNLILAKEDKSELDIVDEQHYIVKVYRPQRLVDKGFNGALIILGIINTAALGCISELRDLKRRVLEKKRELFLAIVIQYIVMPLVTYGLTRISSIQNEISLGYLIAVCVPGGGLGYLIISITSNTDKNLNILQNILQIVLPIGALPLWVYSLASTLKNGGGEVSNSIYFLVLWIIGLLVPYALGIAFSRKSAMAADAFLNWLVKPMLLLAFILFITLGLYINMYMFAVLDTKSLVTGALIPLIGFSLGGSAILALKLGTEVGKTVAIETAIMNSVVVMAAIRFTLPQPDADYASAAVLWLLFFTPVPFVLMFIFHRIKRKIASYFDKKDFEKSHEITLKQSFAAIAQNAFQIGGIGQNPTESHSTEPATQSNDNNVDQDTTMLLMESGSSGISTDGGQVLQNRLLDKEQSRNDNITNGNNAIDVVRVSFEET